jgi:hypothetical protein
MWYTLKALDSDNFELATDEVQGKKAAIERARYLLSAEYGRAIEGEPAVKVNIYLDNGECVDTLCRFATPSAAKRWMDARGEAILARARRVN